MELLGAQSQFNTQPGVADPRAPLCMWTYEPVLLLLPGWLFLGRIHFQA